MIKQGRNCEEVGLSLLAGRFRPSQIRYPFILTLDSHCARHIWHESFVLAKYFKGNDQRLSIFSSLRVERFHDGRAKNRFIFLFSFFPFFFFLFARRNIPLFSRGEISHVPRQRNFRKLERDSLLPGMRTILRYRVITQLRGSTFGREKRCTLSFFLVDFWWT